MKKVFTRRNAVLGWLTATVGVWWAKRTMRRRTERMFRVLNARAHR
jgi:hypothetical protein